MVSHARLKNKRTRFDSGGKHIKDSKESAMKELPNEKKARLLGMPYGTATNKLRKMLLFECVKMLGADSCYRCRNKIETLEEFSIEHTISWQGTSNPKETFFDLSKIAYSHLRCNVVAGNNERRIYASPLEKSRAESKRQYSDPVRYRKHLDDKKAGYHRRKNREAPNGPVV